MMCARTQHTAAVPSPRTMHRRAHALQVFGSDCYTQSLVQINRDCRSMTDEQRYKLAHAMNRCFLASSGHKGYTCTPAMSARECSGGMDDRAFMTYNSFFTNIHSICLYVANRAFEAHTSQLINKLFATSAAAGGVLANITAGLGASSRQQQLLHEDMIQVTGGHSAAAAAGVPHPAHRTGVCACIRFRVCMRARVCVGGGGRERDANTQRQSKDFIQKRSLAKG